VIGVIGVKHAIDENSATVEQPIVPGNQTQVELSVNKPANLY